MNIKDVFFSKSHLVHPFTVPDRPKTRPPLFTTMEKVRAIALSILIGVVTAGIGGVIAFYLITAAMKAKKLNSEKKPKNQAVGFGGARVREFNGNECPENVGLLLSTEWKPAANARLKQQPRRAAAQNIRIWNRTSLPTPADLTIGSRAAVEDLQSKQYHFTLDDASPGLFEQEPGAHYPTSIQNRRFPPLSICDTVIHKDNCYRSAHAVAKDVKLYKDGEILELHPSTRTIDLDDHIKAEMTDNGKVVIQQQAMRGCTAAVAAMLIYDARKLINLHALRSTNLGDTEDIKQWITEAGLTPRVTELGKNIVVRNLQKLVQDHGSAIVSTHHDIGNHVLIVDAISDDLSSVRLRDPYHGWAITVTQAAFLRGFSGGDVIQID